MDKYVMRQRQHSQMLVKIVNFLTVLSRHIHLDVRLDSHIFLIILPKFTPHFRPDFKNLWMKITDTF